MATYKTFKSLEGKVLKNGDKVSFTISGKQDVHIVNDDYLCSSTYNNDVVFDSLGMTDEESKNAFASKYYGYEIEDGEWPCSKDEDFEALTRLVLALFAVIEDLDVEIEVPTQVITIETTKVKVDKFVKPITVKLNSEYEAKVFSDKVVVGCQTIPMKAVEQLIKSIQELKEKK